MLHVFVYVVRSTQNHFSGIQRAITAEGHDHIINICFDEADFDLIDLIEYSSRRFFRMFYYPRIFRRLCEKLDHTIAAAGSEPINVYFSDEGVWAVVWADYRRHLNRTQLRGINVQHGFAGLRVARFLFARRLINMASRWITGFPCLGYGSLGGCGAKAFDLYLTYDAPAARFAQLCSGRVAIPAPCLIKHDLIEGVSALTCAPVETRTRVLFAMNVKVRGGSPIKCDAAHTFDELLELATVLRELGARLVLRLHPGMDNEADALIFASHPISQVAELDSHTSLYHSLADSIMVMSFFSSILWEAGLVGMVSVQVICRCCNTAKLYFEHEELKLDSDLRSRLENLLLGARTPHPQNWHELESAEWARVRPELLPY